MPTRIPPPHSRGRFPRESLLQAIHKEPGLGVRQLAQRTGHAGITVSKHLAQLRKEGQVVAVKDDKSRLHHFLVGRTKPLEPEMTAIDRDILAVLDDLPCTFWGLQQRFPAVPKSTLQYRVKRLVDLGFVERDHISRPAILNVLRWPKTSRISD